MNILLETNRLIVNKPSLDDIDDQFILQSDPDVMQYIAEGKPREIEKVRQLLIKCNMVVRLGFIRWSLNGIS